MKRAFQQVDVFGSGPYTGNPVAVVLDGEGLSDADMQRLANWTNLSETTFVLPPTDPGADYRLRIFTTTVELPFAGHPTLGSAHAWLTHDGSPRRPAAVVQECGAGLVSLRPTADRIGFAAPALVRSGPLERGLAAELAETLGIALDDVVDSQWVDNGPGWAALLLRTAAQVRAAKPRLINVPVGVVGPYGADGPADFEVRAFFPSGDTMFEDPVTGSLNASLAQWLLSSGRARAPYVASQGTVLGRAGRVYIDLDPDGTVWVAGTTVTCVEGSVDV